MKKYVFLFLAAFCLAEAAPSEAQTAYGKSFKVKNAQTPDELAKKLENQSEIKGV